MIKVIHNNSEIQAKLDWIKKGNAKQNRFPTLSDALEAENIAHMWDMHPLSYGETYGMTYQDGTKHGHYVSVHRFSDGHYERPIHYKRG